MVTDRAGDTRGRTDAARLSAQPATDFFTGMRCGRCPQQRREQSAFYQCRSHAAPVSPSLAECEDMARAELIPA